MSILVPQYSLTYEGTNITADLAPYSIGLRYINSIESESAELELTIGDWDGKWINNWVPEKGDRISAQFGYQGEAVFDAGSFEVDELDYSAPPSTLVISALATPFSASLREKRSIDYENVSLAGIAQSVAKRHGLEVTGEIPDVTFKRKTQNDTDDLAFLRSLADEYDLLVKVENGKIVFYSQSALEREPVITTLTPSDLARIRLTDSLSEVYESVSITYQDPEKQETVESTKAAVVDSTVEKRADVLYLNLRVEDKLQADLIAKGKLRQANAEKLTGSISAFIGRTDLDAGVNFSLAEFGSWSGNYQITEITHSISSNGSYSTEARIRRIYLIE